MLGNQDKMVKKSKICMRIQLVFYFLLIEYICHFPFKNKPQTKSGVHSSPLLHFRKPEFFHTFSVIPQHKKYRKCMEDVKFSKKRQRTSVHSTFSV